MSVSGREREEAYLFSSTDATVDLVKEASSDHFEEDKARSRVEDLLVRSPIALVLQICMSTGTLSVHSNTHRGIRGLYSSEFRGVFLRVGFELVRGPIFSCDGGDWGGWGGFDDSGLWEVYCRETCHCLALVYR